MVLDGAGWEVHPWLDEKERVASISTSFLHMKSLVDELESNQELIDWAIVSSSLQCF